MAITREVLNVQDDYCEELTLYRPMFSEWEIIDQREVKDGKEAIYQLMSGDPAYPTRIRIGAYEKDGRKSLSAKLTTYVKVTDDNDVITYVEDEYVVAHNDRSGQFWNKTGDSKVLGNLLLFSGFIAPAATPALASPVTGDYTIVNRIKFGIPTFDPSTVDDPATS